VSLPTNKSKIINDPVYGFIKIPFGSTYDLVEHSYFQRLRRIKQLGLTNYVYPGACHTRYQHALGATHLMWLAIEVLRTKGNEITDQEAEASINAILLHDIGHGPFSHALEHSIIEDITHEELSLRFMEHLNAEFSGRLDLAIEIYTGRYHKKFLHQLVTSQLDVDRLDYLMRDSFFTGVSEGVIGSDRIIKMLSVVSDQLVVDAKGIYSIEKFLIARRLMYWQVYMHKAVLAAEIMIVKIMQRAKHLSNQGIPVRATPDLEYFLNRSIKQADFKGRDHHSVLDRFANLDDSDIITSVKAWKTHPDIVLSTLCKRLIDRKLFRIIISDKSIGEEHISRIRELARSKYGIEGSDLAYLVSSGEISNNAYSSEDEKIKILYHGGQLKDVADASDMLDISVLSKIVKKYYLWYPKDLS
jgi:HD superfamily phosphohydrolase